MLALLLAGSLSKNVRVLPDPKKVAQENLIDYWNVPRELNKQMHERHERGSHIGNPKTSLLISKLNIKIMFHIRQGDSHATF